MKISLIVAMDAERGIGRNNDLMWHLPADMKFFRETTSGHVVVMGRKNYESIPERFRPLPNRENAVLSRNSGFDAPGCVVFTSLGDCIARYAAENCEKLFIIGGGQIYREALESGIVEEMFITHVDGTFGADTFFPEFDAADWEKQRIGSHAADEKHVCAFEMFRYTRK